MRTRRLPGFEYFGFFHYSLTMCTFERRRHFAERRIVEHVRGAYCFMPDHVHLLASGRQDNADLVRFAKRSRQRVGFAMRGEVGTPFWQDGYFDHILRDHEPLARTIRYVADNPVRAGLARSWEQYPFTGSQLGSLEHVLEWLDERSGHDEDALIGLT